MALLDIFKRKKPRKVPSEPRGKKPEKAKEEVREVKPPAAAVAPKLKKILGQAHLVLRKPHVTEKATDLTSKNQYIFEVFPRSNKNQIKRAVEDVYGVNVVNVAVINVPRKKRKLGKIEGWRKGYKKAIVKIKEGQKIEVLPR